MAGAERTKGQTMANILAVPGPNSKYQQPGAQAAGFWAGLWHGLICWITFIVSLFSPGVRIYETNNRGLLYDFGFLLGASSALGSSGSQTSHVMQ
jgi:hypothetical protein